MSLSNNPTQTPDCPEALYPPGEDPTYTSAYYWQAFHRADFRPTMETAVEQLSEEWSGAVPCGVAYPEEGVAAENEAVRILAALRQQADNGEMPQSTQDLIGKLLYTVLSMQQALYGRLDPEGLASMRTAEHLDAAHAAGGLTKAGRKERRWASYEETHGTA